MVELWVKEHVLLKFRQMLHMSLQKRWHQRTRPSTGPVFYTPMPQVGDVRLKIYQFDGYKLEFDEYFALHLFNCKSQGQSL